MSIETVGALTIILILFLAAVRNGPKNRRPKPFLRKKGEGSLVAATEDEWMFYDPKSGQYYGGFQTKREARKAISRL